MNRITMLTLTMLSLVTRAPAGEARFEPSVQVVDVQPGVATASIDVYVNATDQLLAFQSIETWIGSNQMEIVGFAVDADFVQATTWGGFEFHKVELLSDVYGYASAVRVGGLFPADVVGPVRLGTLTVQLPAGHTGAHFIEVNPERDLFTSVIGSGGSFEGLFGHANVLVRGADAAACDTDGNCEDGDTCTDDVCLDGTCGHPFNVESCDDGNDCTIEDRCSAGVCDGRWLHGCCRTDADCVNVDPCTDVMCLSGECAYIFNEAPCDDGRRCTELDQCHNGVCAGLSVSGCCAVDADCDDGNYCTDDFCRSGQCVYDANDKLCGDSNPCTEHDQCVGGTCVGTPIPACCIEHIECFDGDDNTNDYCAGNQCLHIAIVPVCITDTDCDDANECTIEHCVAGLCRGEYSTQPCDDFNKCTFDDVCTNGSCAGTPVVECCDTDETCDDGEPCTTDACILHGCVHVPFENCDRSGAGGAKRPERSAQRRRSQATDQSTSAQRPAVRSRRAEETREMIAPDQQTSESTRGPAMCGAMGCVLMIVTLLGLCAERRLVMGKERRQGPTQRR